MLIQKKTYTIMISIAALAGVWYLLEQYSELPVETIPTRVKEVLGETLKQSEGVVQRTTESFFTGTSRVSRNDEKRIIDVQAIVDATNKERLAEGLTPLGVSTMLNQSATVKVEDMLSRQYFEHESPNGLGVAELAGEAGYDYVVVGENLALGDFVSAQDIVTAWMESPGHRANILNVKYKEIGIGLQKGVFEGATVWVAVQHFGSPRSSCPNIDTSIKKDIALLNTILAQQEGEILRLRTELQSEGAVNRPSYITEVATFNQLVDRYNQGLAESRELVSEYNQQVRVFNTCIGAFQ